MDMQQSKSGGRSSGRRIFRIPVILLIVALPGALISCRKPAPSSPPILREGDTLNGMTIASGIPHAVPLEVFCSSEAGEDVTRTVDCQVPPLPRLAIGHMVGVTGGAFQELDWSQLEWQVSLDGYLLDLDTFDQETYLEPGLASSPSSIREVFRHRKTWDIVLVDPTLGQHTLLCTVKAKAAVYSWIVNFMINSTGGPVDMATK